MNQFVIATIFIASLMLTGCSFEPSESDIKQAYDISGNDSWEPFKKSMVDVFGEVRGMKEVAKKKEEALKEAGEFKDLKKIGCKSDGENASLCDFEVHWVKDGNTLKKLIAWRLVKTSDGWRHSQK